MFKKINKTIYIEGMKCDGCVKRVENVLSTIPGVKSCSVSLEDKKADLVLTKNIDDSIFQEKINALGFSIISQNKLEIHFSNKQKPKVLRNYYELWYNKYE